MVERIWKSQQISNQTGRGWNARLKMVRHEVLLPELVRQQQGTEHSDIKHWMRSHMPYIICLELDLLWFQFLRLQLFCTPSSLIQWHYICCQTHKKLDSSLLASEICFHISWTDPRNWARIKEVVSFNMIFSYQIFIRKELPHSKFDSCIW